MTKNINTLMLDQRESATATSAPQVSGFVPIP